MIAGLVFCAIVAYVAEKPDLAALFALLAGGYAFGYVIA